MGGPVNIAATRQIPKRILGLVGVDTYTNFEFKYTPEQIDGILSSFKTDFIATSSNLVRSMFLPKADSILVEQIVADMSSSPPEVGIGALQGFLKFDRVEALKDVQTPIYCINSDKHSTNVEVGQRNALSFGVELMPGVSHFVMMEDPEIFNQLLDKTIKTISL
jgi:pimeloyl-ACP methyl ester carboxylesterase